MLKIWERTHKKNRRWYSGNRRRNSCFCTLPYWRNLVPNLRLLTYHSCIISAKDKGSGSLSQHKFIFKGLCFISTLCILFNVFQFLHKSALLGKEYSLLKYLKLNAENCFCKQLVFSKLFCCIAIFREIYNIFCSKYFGHIFSCVGLIYCGRQIFWVVFFF